jgi:hypothetical protein
MERSIRRATDDAVTSRMRLGRYLRVLARPYMVHQTRVALASMDLLVPENATELDRYVAAGFNTVVVEHRRWNGTSYTELTGDQIRTKLHLARSRGLSIIVSCYADVNGPIPALTKTQVKDRMKLWADNDEGDVIGVFFIGDDNFLTQTPSALQKEWRAGLREVTTSVPVYGMIGELSINALPEHREEFFDTRAWDHLMVLMYPYNLGDRWETENYLGQMVNHEISNNIKDADQQLRDYIDDYISELNRLYLSQLDFHQQILLVTQGFNYVGEPDGKIVRPEDVQIQIEYAPAVLRTLRTQRDNYSCAVFWWGSTPGLTGLRDNLQLTEAARRANKALQMTGSCNQHLTCAMSFEVNGMRHSA